MNWIQRLGDLLAIPQDVIVAGNLNGWAIWRLLRMHGVSVRRVRTERDPAAPWWNRWARNTDVIVGRYEDIAAAAILRQYGYTVHSPAEDAAYEHVPRRYAARLAAIEAQAGRLQQPQRPQPWQPHKPVALPVRYGARKVPRRMW